jgi:predicted nucleotide-binding protein
MTKIEALEKANNLLEISTILLPYKENNNQEYDKWYRKIEDFFEQIPTIEKYFTELEKMKFKDNSVQQSFDKVYGGTAESDRYNKTIKDTKALLESVIDKINEWDNNIILNFQKTKHGNTTINLINISSIEPKTKVFIVHGHDNGAKQEVARFLEKLNLEPIILHEQTNGGNITIIEKIEEYVNQVGFGIVLYTPCDIGGKNENSLQSRARQNVVFEHGYLIGLLGRNKVSPFVKGNIETPGDISGVVYTSMDDNGSWYLPLARELKNAGYEIDFNKLL